MAVGLVVRILPAFATGLDNDEVYTMEDSILLLDDAPPEGVRSFPLVYSVTRVAIEIFGLTPFAMRVFPLLCGILAILVIGRVGETTAGLVSPRQAMLGGLVLALWPWHQYFSGYARFYAPLFLFSTLAMLALWRVSSSRRDGAAPEASRRRSAAAVWWSALAIATHPSGVMAVSGALAPLGQAETRRRSGRLGLVAVALMAGLFLVGIVFTPYGAPLRSVLSGQVGLGSGALSFALSLLNNVTLPIVAASLLGAVVVLCVDRRAAYFLILCASAPILAVGLFSATGQAQARYAMAAMPAVILLAGVGLDFLLRVASTRGQAALVIAAALLPLAPGVISNITDGDRHDWNGTADLLRAGLQRDDLVIAEEHGLVRNGIYGYDYRDLPGGGDPPYPRALIEAPPQASVLEAIDEHRSSAWFVIPENKIEAPPGRDYHDLVGWLRERARVVDRVGARRLDYHRNVIAVLRVGGTVE